MEINVQYFDLLDNCDQESSQTVGQPSAQSKATVCVKGTSRFDVI